MKARWIGGNRARLLENGEAYYPRVFEAIAAARRQVLIETFILFEDKVGNELHRVLVDAARRGVQIDLTADGYGSSDLTPGFLAALGEAGVRVHLFDPKPKILGFRRNLFRRMHRKIVVIDAELAFVGGINFSADHLADFGPMAKQDYAVEVRGPIVAVIHRFVLGMLPRERRRTLRQLLGEWLERRRREAAEHRLGARPEDGVLAAFVVRDNGVHRNDIERQYRIAFRAAQSYVCLANAYFFPGYRLLRDMRRAARRGVRVELILQGEPDMPIVRIAARMLYEHLLRAGVRIHEYCERPLHGKVAVVDDEWATVGSSNLDPLSLSLNLEANLMLRDRDFAVDLRRRLERLIEEHCKVMEPGGARNSGLWRLVPSFAVFHVLRRFPKWATWLPTHEPRLKTVGLRPDEGERSPGARAAQDEAGPPAGEGERREQHALH
ncbi:MAG: cardiolipin synthase ClsB [Burkholderiaceae bacterium]|nr:cardiolipin synthase ClsB [Burkholderiaceae bacterium]